MDSYPTKLRLLLRQLWNKAKDRVDRIANDEWMNLSQATAEASKLSRGGWLFQHYLECNARAEDHKVYKQALEASVEDDTIDFEVESRLIQKYKSGFVLWLLTSAGVPAYQQLFYLIFVLEYKGLSRSGIEMLHRMQSSLSLRTFDAHRKLALDRVSNINREVMSGSFVLWMDNYSHIYRIQHLIRKTGPYRSCLWAGEAVHQYHCPDHPVSLNYISDPRTNRRVLAMPPDLFHELDSIKITLARRDGEGNRYYDSSLCVKYKVNNVPLKPEVNPEVNPQLAELLAEGRDGLKYFHPMHIYQLNPGSDVGLHRYAAGIAYRIKNVAEMKNRYIPLKVDSNIFYRWLPLLYGNGKIAEFMKSSVSLVLGVWHPYKVACERVYQSFLPTVWGPVTHIIDPKTTILYRPQLVQIVALFTQARLAYRSFQSRLLELVEDPHLLPSMRVHAQNLVDLFEFFLPVVQDYGIALKLDDGKQMYVHISRLLKLFFCLGSPLYESALLAHMLILSHLRRFNHPVWQMMHHNLSAFNEECGELSFSVLSRSTQGDSLRSDVEHMNDTYRLIHQYRAVADDFESTLYMKQKVAPKHFKIATDSVEVKAMAAHFKEVIALIKSGKFKPYRISKNRKGPAYRTKEKEDNLREEMKDPIRKFLPDVSAKLQYRVDALRKRLETVRYSEETKLLFTANLSQPPVVSDSVDPEMEEDFSDSDSSEREFDLTESKHPTQPQANVSIVEAAPVAHPMSVRASHPPVPKSKKAKPKPVATNVSKRTLEIIPSSKPAQSTRPAKKKKASPPIADSTRPSGLRERPRLNYNLVRRDLGGQLLEADDDHMATHYMYT